MNEIELFDNYGENLLEQIPFEIKAIPEGVFQLEKMKDDERKIENIINGNTNSNKFEDIWLSQLIQHRVEQRKNVVYINFDKPFLLSMVNIWNYIKTP